MTIVDHKIALVRQSLADHLPVAIEDLLLPRDPAGNLARELRPPPGVLPRESATLLLFYPHEDDLWLPLTVRSSRLPQHRGEVSLPGGATDPEDTGPEATALRETHEELGIDPNTIEIWGALSSLYIPPSNFQLTPMVGFTRPPFAVTPNPEEIVDVFSVSLTTLMNPDTVEVEEWTLHGRQVHVPFFALSGYKVWGATAIVLSELLVRLRRISPGIPTQHP